MTSRHNFSAITGMAIAGVAAAVAALLSGCGPVDSAVTSGSGVESLHSPPPSTPRGISLVEVTREMGASQPEFLWTRIGDDQANTLLIYAKDTEPGKSNCSAECAQEFPPFEAPSDAKGFGDWSLIARADGKRQWAYQQKPLYRSAKETKLGELVTNVVAEEGKKTKLAGGGGRRKPKDTKPPLLPPPGWTIARFDPGKSIPHPPGIGIRPVVVENGTGVGLVTTAGMTLYGFTGSASAAQKAECIDQKVCEVRFAPALVPGAFAGSVGDFGTIRRSDDNSRQWTFRGVPLYTFSGDAKPGDSNGAYGGDGTWEAVLLSIDRFPDSVRYIQTPVKGQILATANAQPLYNRAIFEARWGGFTTYQGYSNSFRMGHAVNVGACNEECLKTRVPLPARGDATTKGYWQPLTREDGRKQWSYKGFALYTYSKDTSPGLVSGSNVTDYVISDVNYRIADVVAGSASSGMGLPAGYYWYVARP